MYDPEFSLGAVSDRCLCRVISIDTAARQALDRKLDGHTVNGLNRLALCFGLDQAGGKKDKIRRLADYHDGSPQQADDLLGRLRKVSYREQQSRSSPSVWVVAAQVPTVRRRQAAHVLHFQTPLWTNLHRGIVVVAGAGAGVVVVIAVVVSWCRR